MSYSDKALLSLGWDEAKIKRGRMKCKSCGKERMLHSASSHFCPLPKKGIVQNYSQSQSFTEAK